MDYVGLMEKQKTTTLPQAPQTPHPLRHSFHYNDLFNYAFFKFITCNILTKEQTTNYEILIALSYALNVDVNYLIGASNKKHSHIVHHAYKTLEASIQNLIDQENDTVKVKDIATNTVGELNDLRYEYNKKRYLKNP